MYIADEARHLDRLKPPRSSRNAAASPSGHRAGALCCSTGSDRSSSQTVEGFWRGAGHGDRRAVSHGRLSGRLYRVFRQRGVCAARISEKIEVRHRDAETRNRVDPQAPRRGGATLQGKAELTCAREKSSGSKKAPAMSSPISACPTP